MDTPTPPFQLIATDLDGTLLRTDQSIGEEDRKALAACGERGIVRVAATGRSYYSAQRVLSDDAPIDYLVFSCGAGVLRWRDRELLHARMFPPHEALTIGNRLRSLELDFMVHTTIPDNHLFWYSARQENPDLTARIAHYAQCVRGELSDEAYQMPVTQFLVTLSCDETVFGGLQEHFAPFAETIRSTSPFLPEYKWLELFPRGVNKGTGLEWLCATLGVAAEKCRVVGNDYNDLAMLERFPQSYVVANAPLALRERFRVVSDHNACGVAEAIGL